MREREDRNSSRLSLMHMKEPASPQGLVFRCVYHMPFWQIEATEKRWNWQVALESFEATDISQARAERFQANWKTRLFPELEAQSGDHVYIPLQGRLLDRRSFQSCSPIKMAKAVLSATDRPVVFGLHPKETYTEKELETLRKTIAPHSNATLVMGDMDQHLPSCHLVVTQNSAVAFNGYFFNKRAILLAGIDFHHIAQKATDKTLAAAMDQTPGDPPNFAQYLWWFWQIKSINAGRPNARDKIRYRLAALGWPVA